MKYAIKIYPRAYRDLDGIYSYIAKNLMVQGTAENLLANSNRFLYTVFAEQPNAGTVRTLNFFKAVKFTDCH